MVNEKIGFIGLGTMGAPMALNVQKGGYELGIYSRSAARAKPFRAKGASVFDTPAALAEWADVVVIMVTGDAALLDVLGSEDGVAGGLDDTTTVINMSTVSREATMRAANIVEGAGAKFLDAPVSGSKVPAQAGQLIILAGGDAALIAELTPLLSTMGGEIVHCGPAGAGTDMKMTINLLLGSMITGLAEALTLGDKLGLRLEDMLRVIDGGAASSPLFKLKGAAIGARDFSKHFPVSLVFKDLNLILDAAGKAGASLPQTAVTRELFSAAMARGLGDEDLCAVIKVIESLAGGETKG